MIFRFVVALLLMYVMVTTSCKYDNKEDLNGKSSCDTSVVTYENIKKPLEQQCYGCHSGGFPGGNVSLQDYQSLKTYATQNRRILLGAVKHDGASPMPKGGQKWDACTIQKLEAWINQGMKP
jgi:hypothetical protein